MPATYICSGEGLQAHRAPSGMLASPARQERHLTDLLQWVARGRPGGQSETLSSLIMTGLCQTSAGSMPASSIKTSIRIKE